MAEPRRIVVLGNGPTGVFAAHVLAKADAEIQTSLLCTDPLGSLRPVTSVGGIGRQPFTLAPVLPPSDMCDGLAELDVRYVGAEPGPVVNDVPPPGSFQEYARSRSRVTEMLALKQFGVALAGTPMPEVRRKVERSYGFGASGPNRPRSAYIKGESPYATWQREALAGLTHIVDSPVAIDPTSRVIRTASRGFLPYDRIVACVHAERLAELLGVKHPRLVGAAAQFVAYIPRTDVLPNRLVYDLRAGTPIFRVTVPRHDVAIAQVTPTVDLTDDRSLSEVRQATESLLGIEMIPGAHSAARIESAYPVEGMADDDAGVLAVSCEAAGALPFGRRAEWRYLDLHELNWRGLVESCTS